ncbi:WXG100 family type VII secretion target [Nocardia sp. NPDC051756]|uniref:WXG100 family type VII secretion target n=1 Tax=Nocardia sp. NPDC051756 TaxID=3154751 RepID=UPI003445A718
MKVDPAAVHQTAQWLQQQADDMSTAIEAHIKVISNFLNSDWQGTAATSHQDPWTEWADGARRTVGSFYTDVGALHTVADTYTTTDTNHATEISQTGSSLNLPPI